MKPTSIEESGVRGIASRHGYKVEPQELALYNLASDPGEQVNLAAQNPQLVARLSEHIAKFRSELGDSLTKLSGTGLRPKVNRQ